MSNSVGLYEMANRPSAIVRATAAAALTYTHYSFGGGGKVKIAGGGEGTVFRLPLWRLNALCRRLRTQRISCVIPRPLSVKSRSRNLVLII